MLKHILVLLIYSILRIDSLQTTITFNIDSDSSASNTNSIYRQSFNQSTINYCNFDPFLLNSKHNKLIKELNGNQDNSLQDDLKVNVLMSDEYFNETNPIIVNVQFKNKQADSSKLWYLLETKSVCTNQVLGVWRLEQHKNTDTIYCFNPDDTLFGHKSKIEDTLFTQTWTPTNTFEDVYFVLAIFTDEIYSDLNPTYYLVSTPSLKFKSSNYKTDISDDYDTKCTSKLIRQEQDKATQMEMSSTLIETTTVLTNKKKLNRLNSIPADRSIFVDLVANFNDCFNVDPNLTQLIKSQLESIYKNVANFERLEIVNVLNKGCHNRRTLSNQNVIYQHYVLFDQPIKNETKFNLINTLKKYLLTEPKIQNLNLVDSYLPNENSVAKLMIKNLNNSCDLYEFYSICQNGGICQENLNQTPTCVCQSNDWSGKFCDARVDQTLDSDKIKMFITIGCLASFAIISLLALLIYVIYKRRKQKKIIKKVISERSQICITSSNETSINDEYPRLNHYNSKLNTISYPRELIIASSPIKKLYRAAEASVNESEQELQSDASSRKNSEQYAEHSHVNYGYNLTFDSDLPFESNTYNKNNNINHYNQNKLSVSSIDSNNFNLKAFWKNEKNLDNIIHQKSDMYERRLELAKIVNNIPHSFEKQMARNFHNLTGNSSSPINSASLETGSSDFINRYSKYTDTTSISTNQSLKDEDAWLPILNLAEEQILKYQNEEAREMEYCVM